MVFPERSKIYSADMIFYVHKAYSSQWIEEIFPNTPLAYIHSCSFQEEDNILRIRVWIWSTFVTRLQTENFYKAGLQEATDTLENLAESMDCSDLHFKYIDNVEEEESMIDVGAFDRYDMEFLQHNPEVFFVIMEYIKRFPTPPSRGCGRIAFYDLEKSLVYKIPLRKRGVNDNNNEAVFCKDPQSNLADCEIVNPGNKLPILKMEMLDTDISGTKLPNWANDIEHHQVGFDKNGRLKAFDLY